MGYISYLQQTNTTYYMGSTISAPKRYISCIKDDALGNEDGCWHIVVISRNLLLLLCMLCMCKPSHPNTPNV